MKRYTIDEAPQEVFENLFSVGSYLSEYSYANLFLFKKKHQYQIIEGNRGFFLEGLSYDKKCYLMPLNNLTISGDYLHELKSIFINGDYEFIFPISESWLSLFDDSWESSYLEEDSDYIYSRKDLAHLEGRKYHKKRNLIKQHKALYRVESRELLSDDIEPCLELLKQWASEYYKATGSEDIDFDSCSQALLEKERLGLTGNISFADDQITGFSLGEGISSEVYAIHFAKANVQFKGDYQFLFQELCSAPFIESYDLINMEQDLGLPGLRQAKRSYYPVSLSNKFRVKLKK